jgi:aryl-alcohol dehydrogenase-like predicted oxidoreductase
MALNDYYTLGSSGLRVSSLALGTMTFDEGARPADSFAILDCYLGLGGNFIDTANFYGGDQSEETLGAYFTANPGRRERVVLATKFCMSLIPDDPNAGGAGRKAIIAQLDRSLSRLKTDYVDLYWQHTCGTGIRRLRRRFPRSTTWCAPVRCATSACRTSPPGLSAKRLPSRVCVAGSRSRHCRSSIPF